MGSNGSCCSSVIQCELAVERAVVCCPVLLLFATSEEGGTDTGDMAQRVKCLLCKHEDQSSIPRAYVKTKKIKSHGEEF